MIAPPQDIGLAVRMYYEKIVLTTSDIKELFGNIGASTVTKYKNKAKQVMAEENVMPWNSSSVDTVCAYKAWGLDIADLEHRYAKLKKLNQT